jgi:hypothetical protein
LSGQELDAILEPLPAVFVVLAGQWIVAAEERWASSAQEYAWGDMICQANLILAQLPQPST